MSESMVIVTATVVGLVAAIRSSWSPCGHSMLSTMTPLGERSRGHRWGTTASWFVAGGVLGGLGLGVVMAALAVLVAAVDLSSTTIGVVAVVATGAAVVLDAQPGRLRAPGTRRQVNEAWLTAYRPWVYGLGFGAQIGCGVGTYLMTAAVYLLVVLGALSATPVAALVLGAGFGLVRGCAVMAGWRLTDPEALRAFHRRFDALGPVSRLGTVAVETAVLLVAAVALLPLPIAVTVVVIAAGVVPLLGVLLQGGVVPHSRPWRARGSTRVPLPGSAVRSP
jgi:hypothetical protein